MVDLIITNGDMAGELLRRTLQGSEVLPWRDVLHEGPVPLTETPQELTEARVAYLADAGAGDVSNRVRNPLGQKKVGERNIKVASA